MRSRLQYGYLLLAAFMGAGCDESLSESAMVVRDSAGVRVVEHNVLPQRTAFVLGDPLYRVGWSDAGPEFQMIGSGVVLDRGWVAVADAGANHVVLLNEIGEVEATLGGSGEGPGEIGRLRSVYTLADDTLVVEDGGNARFTLYHRGQFVGAHTPEDGRAMFELMGAGLVDRSLILSVAGYPPFFEESWLKVPIVRHPLGTEEWDTVAHYDFRPRVARGETLPPFRPIGLIGTHPDGVLVGRGDRPQVAVLDLEGTTTQIIRWGGTPLEFTDSIWSIYTTYRMGRLGSRTEQEMRAYLEELRVAADDVLPYMSEVRGDAIGRIWVSQFSPDYRYPPSYRVFGPDGDWLGWVGVPPRTEILDVRARTVLGIQRNELDVDAVVLLPINRS